MARLRRALSWGDGIDAFPPLPPPSPLGREIRRGAPPLPPHESQPRRNICESIRWKPWAALAWALLHGAELGIPA